MSDKARSDVDEAKALAAWSKGHPLPTWHVLMAKAFGCRPDSFWKLWRLGLIRCRPGDTYYVPMDVLSAYVENNALLPGTKLTGDLSRIAETQAHHRALARMQRG
jgi:hypothetical protein